MIKKTVVFTGYACNNRCIFCIDLNKRTINSTTKTILRDIYAAKIDGVDYLEIIGWEVTIRKDFFLILSFIKKLGFQTVMFATNWVQLADFDFCKKMVWLNVVSNIVFSIHWHAAELHDYLVDHPGAFDSIQKGIVHLHKLWFENIWANCAIVQPNYNFLPDIGQYIHSLGIQQAEFIFADPNQWGVCDNFSELMPKISDVAPYARKLLDYWNLQKLKYRVRYVPLCYFADYIETDNISELMEVATFHTKHIAPDFTNDDVSLGRQNTGRMKPEKCKKCRLYDQCEWIWVNYYNQLWDNELQPL